jgi:non-ribosomal peptide synthetase component F
MNGRNQEQPQRLRWGGFADTDVAQLWRPEPKRRSRTRHTAKPPGTTPRFRVLHEIFETQADARPEAVAGIFGQEATTYFDLENYANRLARHLRTLEVRPVHRGDRLT